MSTDGDAPIPPRYGHRSLADVVPALVAALLGTAEGASADGRDPERTEQAAPGSVTAELAAVGPKVVLLVVDGLGSRLLDDHATAAPTLTSCPGDDVDAVFPSTTVASLASIGTGQPPGVHGLVGYSWPLRDHEHPLAPLGWRIGLRGGGFDAREIVVPEQLQPAATAFERAAEAGVATTVVLHPELLDSGLTRAVLRGGQRVAARGLAATLDRAVHEVASVDGPALAYAHEPEVDWAGHEFGPHSPEARDAVADVDRTLTALRRRLPGDVTVVVTADHGMLEVPEEDVVELADSPELLDGVRVLAGEPRVRQVALEDGVEESTVADRWRSVLGDRALVLTCEQALPLFAPDPSRRGRAAVGDLVVIARRGSLVHERVDPHGGRHHGQHGGLTDVELLVPLLRLEGRS